MSVSRTESSAELVNQSGWSLSLLVAVQSVGLVNLSKLQSNWPVSLTSQSVGPVGIQIQQEMHFCLQEPESTESVELDDEAVTGWSKL